MGWMDFAVWCLGRSGRDGVGRRAEEVGIGLSHVASVGQCELGFGMTPAACIPHVRFVVAQKTGTTERRSEPFFPTSLSH